MGILISEVVLDAQISNYIQFNDFSGSIPFITHRNGKLAYNGSRFASSDGSTWHYYVAQDDLASAAVLSATELAIARSIAMSGDVVWSVSFNGSGNVTATATIQNGVVTNAKMASMANQTFKGNNSGISAVPQDLSVTTVNTMLGTVTLTGTQTISGAKTFSNHVDISGGFGLFLFNASGDQRISLGGASHGSIEIGDISGTAGAGTITPFMDWHYAVGSAQDYNVRIVNHADGYLLISGLTGGLGSLRVAGSVEVGYTSGAAFKAYGTSSASSHYNSLVANGWAVDGGTNADTRLLLLNGTGSPTNAISFNLSTAYDAAGTFSMQKRTTANSFVANIWGINLTNSKIWFGGNGGGTLNGIINVIGECQVQTVGCLEVAKGTVTSSASIAWASGFYQSFTLTSATACTVSFSAPPNPCELYIKISAPASGTSPTITWPATVKGSPPTTVTLAKVSVLEFFFDGTNYYFIGACQNV